MNYDPIQARFQILYSTRHVYQNLTTVSGQTRKCWDKVDILTIAPMDMYFQLQLVTVCLYFIFNCPIFSDTWAYCSSSSSLLMADRYFFGLDDRDTTQTIKQIFKIELRHSKLERDCGSRCMALLRSRCIALLTFNFLLVPWRSEFVLPQEHFLRGAFEDVLSHLHEWIALIYLHTKQDSW